MPKICPPQKIEKLANSKNVDVLEDVNGRIRLTSRADRAVYGTFDTKGQAREYLIEMGRNNNLIDLDGGLPTVHRAEVTNAAPPRPQAQLDLDASSFRQAIRKGIKSFQAGVGAPASPIKSTFQAIELIDSRLPAFSKVFEPTQAAMTVVGNKLAQTGRKALGLIKRGRKQGQGITYSKAIQNLERNSLGLTPEEGKAVTLLNEAFTKTELERPGVLLAEGMDDLNIAASKRISRINQADNIPIYVRLNKVMDSFLDNRGKVKDEIATLRTEILDGKLPTSASPFLDDLERAAVEGLEGLDNASTRGEAWDILHKSLNMTRDESEALLGVRAWMTDGKGRFNTLAIFRHSTAPVAEAGFKATRDLTAGQVQFISQRKVSGQVVQIHRERVRILKESFEGSGFEQRQVIGAQLPAFRQFADVGVLPEVGENAANSFFNLLPEGNAVLTRRVLSGHINPREFDPVISTSKHVRNMIMREDFDDVAREAAQEIQAITVRNEQAGRVAQDYLHELEGFSSKEFKKVTERIRMTGRGLGIQIDDRLAESITNVLSKLSYQSTIPFRAGLIMRNFLQTLFFTLPSIGPRAWLHGLKRASQVETSSLAWEAARKAGALDANVVPLFGGDVIFGVNVSRFTGNLGASLKKVGFNANAVFDAGFSSYRFADDWGRVVAFEAGRKRVLDAQELFFKKGDMEAFKIAAKVKTFDETIEAEFERILLSGGSSEDAANYIGKQLADKTHLLYGKANRPVGWGGPAGRLFGQFGTFPIQYVDYVLDGLTRGTSRDIAEFVALHGAANAGVIVAGAELLDVDLATWITIPSVVYTGGPYAEVAMSMVQSIGGSDAEKSLARRNLRMMLPTLEHPSSIIVPGSYFVGDAVDAVKSTSLSEFLREISGIRAMRPNQVHSVERMFPFMF